MTETITFAGGCFWCTEAVFKRLKGVTRVTPGYSGGNKDNPTYEEVSTGTTNHAEAIQIYFDPAIISLDHLFDIFFATHDPTTKNRQGADTGTQYRSAIFYHTDTQKQQALSKIKALENDNKFINPIVTEVTPLKNFYKAEDYHLNYYDTNPLAPYCQIVIDPKIKKLIEKYSKDIKQEYK